MFSPLVFTRVDCTLCQSPAAAIAIIIIVSRRSSHVVTMRVPYIRPTLIVLPTLLHVAMRRTYLDQTCNRPFMYHLETSTILHIKYIYLLLFSQQFLHDYTHFINPSQTQLTRTYMEIIIILLILFYSNAII